jgi:hypothetical protein
MDRLFVKLHCDILTRKDLTLAAKVVYAVLCHDLRGRTTSRLGYGELARRAGIGRTTAIRAVAELAGKTDLEVEHGGQSRGCRNTYRLSESRPESDQSSRPEPGQGVGRNRTSGRPEPGQEVGANPATSKRERTTKTKAKRAQAPTFSWEEIQPRVKDTCLDTPEFAELWVAFVAHRQQMKAPLTAAAVTRHLKTMLRHGLKLSIEGLGCAIDSRWKWFQPEWLPSRKAPGSGAPADRQPTEPEQSDYARALAKRKLEGPIIFECREHWPEDVEAHFDEYRAIDAAVQRGKLPFNIVITPWARHITGKEFRDGCRKKLATARRWKKAGAAARNVRGGV